METTVVDVPKSIPTKVLPRIIAEFLTAGKNEDVVISFIFHVNYSFPYTSKDFCILYFVALKRSFYVNILVSKLFGIAIQHMVDNCLYTTWIPLLDLCLILS